MNSVYVTSEQIEYIITQIYENLFTNAVSFDIYTPNLFNLLFIHIYSYISKSENILKNYILKPLPLQIIYVSTPTPYPDANNLINSSNPLDLLDNNSDSEELLLAESLVNMILKYISLKTVKFSGYNNK